MKLSEKSFEFTRNGKNQKWQIQMNQNSWKENFAAIKKKFWGRKNNIEEELKLRKIARKKRDEIERLETEIKQTEGPVIETMKDESLNGLNMEKEIEIDEIKKIETKIEEINIPKIDNTIRESIIPEEHLYHISRQKKYCDYQAFSFVNLENINPLRVYIFH